MYPLIRIEVHSDLSAHAQFLGFPQRFSFITAHSADPFHSIYPCIQKTRSFSRSLYCALFIHCYRSSRMRNVNRRCSNRVPAKVRSSASTLFSTFLLLFLLLLNVSKENAPARKLFIQIFKRFLAAFKRCVLNKGCFKRNVFTG